MSSRPELKAIVLSCDRYRAITEHMVLQYERTWPDHPFIFQIPYQEARGTDTAKTNYHKTPEDIKGTVLHLLEDLDDEEWVYWCVDDKYPVRLVTGKIYDLITHAINSPDMSGLLFCRCRVTLNSPKVALYPKEIVSPSGDIYFERKAWYQIWLHQLLKVKVLRYLFTHLPDRIPSAKEMDQLKDGIAKPSELRLFVTKENFAVFGESTARGLITQNCYESMIANRIELPDWFRHPNGQHVTMGKL
jgi:hypothetical protein